jgi:hypothetical protein
LTEQLDNNTIHAEPPTVLFEWCDHSGGPVIAT